METLLIATRNAKKRAELTDILAGLPYRVVTLDEANVLATVEETGRTFEDNATLKATTYAALSGLLTLSDDSGLEVDALGGAPGVDSANYGGPGLDDDARYRLVLERLAGTPDAARSARFVCVIAIAQPGDPDVALFRGVVEGRIGHEGRGRYGFGYDPIFIPTGFAETTAEMPPDRKHAISHRGKALAQARDWLAERASERAT